jgi:hypothetical protein
MFWQTYICSLSASSVIINNPDIQAYAGNAKKFVNAETESDLLQERYNTADTQLKVNDENFWDMLKMMNA